MQLYRIELYETVIPWIVPAEDEYKAVSILNKYKKGHIFKISKTFTPIEVEEIGVWTDGTLTLYRKNLPKSYRYTRVIGSNEEGIKVKINNQTIGIYDGYYRLWNPILDKIFLCYDRKEFFISIKIGGRK